MIEINYDNMAEAYNIVCMMNNLKSFCADVDSHIYKFTPLSIPSRLFLWYFNRMARWFWSILNILQRHELTHNYPKDTLLNTNCWINHSLMMGKLRTCINGERKFFSIGFTWIHQHWNIQDLVVQSLKNSLPVYTNNQRNSMNHSIY